MPISKKYLKVLRSMVSQYCTSKYGADGRRDKYVQGIHTCPKARQVFYAKMRKEGIDYRLSELLELLHSRIKCFECNQPPTIDVLWAEGMARCWFCDKHFEEWKKKKFKINDQVVTYGSEINKVRKVKDGEVPKKWSDWYKLSLDTLDIDPLKPKIFPSKKIEEMSNIELEYVHALVHSIKPKLFTKECGLHYKIVKEMTKRNYLHMFKEGYLCDRIIEWGIKDWKTYNPKNISDAVLRDDWRIVHAWMKLVCQKGKKLESIQFKEYSLEQQKKIIGDLRDKIRKEMIERGWQPKKLSFKLPSGMNIEDIDPPFIMNLKDKDLISLYKFLHQEYKKRGKVTEDISNANIFIGLELVRRRLYNKNKIDDDLTKETELEIREYPTPEGFPRKEQSLEWKEIEKRGYITLEDVLSVLPDQLIIKGTVEKPVSIYLIGRIVNVKKVPLDHDIDVLFKTEFIDPKLLYSFYASIPVWLSKILHPVPDINGPEIGNAILIYEPGNYFSHPSRLSFSIKVGRSFVGLKAKSGFHKYEFWDIDEAYKKAVSQYISRGLIIDKKYDGRRFQIHYDKSEGIFKIITEDQQRDRAGALPNISSEIKSFLDKKGIKNVILDSEAVAYDCTGKKVKNKEDLCDFIDREKTAWLTVGTISSEQEESVVFHVHDILYLNDKTVNELGYIDRQRLFRKLIGVGTPHLQVVKSTTADNVKQFISAVKRMRSLPGSEGVMIKVSDSKYRIKYSGENRTSEWIKIKNLKEIDVMVWERVPMKRKETGEPTGAFRYESVFEIPSNKKGQFRESDIVEHKGKIYAKIGLTYATNDRNKRGDIISVRQIRIRKDYDKNNKVYYTWMFPFYAGKRTDKKEPDTLTTVDRLERIGTKPLERNSLERWYKDTFREELKYKEIMERITDENIEDYLDSDTIIISLNKCPFYDKTKICPFRERFKGPYLTKVLEQYLEFPIKCHFADMFICRYVKKYYYPYKIIEI